MIFTNLISISLYHSSEIEQSADDIHAELVEDEDEEVTLQRAVEKTHLNSGFTVSIMRFFRSVFLKCVLHHTLSNF